MRQEKAADTAIEVCAAVIVEDDRYLLTRRLAESHCGLLWEFPGGKRKAGERLEDCLVRELREELGIEIVVGELITTLSHRYPDRMVILHFFQASRLRGEPQALECSEFRWVRQPDFADLVFPEADIAFLSLLFSGKIRS